MYSVTKVERSIRKRTYLTIVKIWKEELLELPEYYSKEGEHWYEGSYYPYSKGARHKET